MGSLRQKSLNPLILAKTKNKRVMGISDYIWIGIISALLIYGTYWKDEWFNY
jgi:hypothetical protein